jgi:hypothetical protein
MTPDLPELIDSVGDEPDRGEQIANEGGHPLELTRAQIQRQR